jgi:hypothetical protein
MASRRRDHADMLDPPTRRVRSALAANGPAGRTFGYVRVSSDAQAEDLLGTA